MSPSPANRRVHPRARFRGIAVLESRGKTISCAAVNLSESGILLFSEMPIQIEPGLVGVVFTLPGLGQWLTVVGEIVHQVKLPSRTILGVHFTAVSDELRDLLRRYVDSTRRDLPPSPDEPIERGRTEDRPDLPAAPVAVAVVAPPPRRPAPLDDLPPLPISDSVPEVPLEAQGAAQDDATLLLEGFDQLAEGIFADNATQNAVDDVLSALRARAEGTRRER